MVPFRPRLPLGPGGPWGPVGPGKPGGPGRTLDPSWNDGIRGTQSALRLR